jgi:hypothetical protein
MIGLFLLLSAASAPADAPPTVARSCRRSAGSEVVTCRPLRPQQGPYRLPKLPPKTYGPPLPGAQANLGHGVKLGGQTSNAGVRRKRSAATLSVPF